VVYVDRVEGDIAIPISGKTLYVFGLAIKEVSCISAPSYAG
jgi:hypothetical protein